MARAQIFGGAWEEIASHAARFKGRNDLLLIVPEQQPTESEEAPPSLAEAMKDYIGSFNFGEANLSENSGEKFAHLLAEKQRGKQQ